MPKTTQTPTSVLLKLMDEYQLNPFSLSKAINLSSSSVRQVLTGKSKISVPNALRLAKFFGQTPAFWLDLQRKTDLSKADKDKELQAVLKGIAKAKKPAVSESKTSKKTGKRNALSEKRKKAAKIPGAKRGKRKRSISNI